MTVAGSRPSLVLPSRPTVVGAASIEFSTASSVASTTASNSGSRPAPGDARARARVAPSRSARAVVEAARKISPLPWWAVEPVRARPSPIRRASRAQPAPSTGASVTTTPMHDPAGRWRAVGAGSGSSRPTGTPGDGQPRAARRSWSAAAPRPCGPSGVTRDDGADAALEAEARHAGAGADRALAGRARSTPREASAAACAARTSSAVDLHPAAVVEERVVALGDHRDHHVVGHPGVLLERDLARGVVHPAELHRRGQVDRRLDAPHSPAVRKPVHSPAPLSTAPPAASGRR